MTFEKHCPLCLQSLPPFETLSDKELVDRLHLLVTNDSGAIRNMAFRAALLTIIDEMRRRCI